MRVGNEIRARGKITREHLNCDSNRVNDECAQRSVSLTVNTGLMRINEHDLSRSNDGKLQNNSSTRSHSSVEYGPQPLTSIHGLSCSGFSSVNPAPLEAFPCARVPEFSVYPLIESLFPNRRVAPRNFQLRQALVSLPRFMERRGLFVKRASENFYSHRVILLVECARDPCVPLHENWMGVDFLIS